MKNFRSFLCLTLACLLLLGLAGQGTALAEAEAVDYASSIELNMVSETKKLEVTVKTFVDGDTTHFHVPESVMPTGVLKARYLAVNTPEVTGKVEEWGKKASEFTREKLSQADAILIESDNASWNPDSTGDRYLVWVWYKPQGESRYRNLNIELLQNGLAIANSSANNRYGSTCMAAINQAKALKLHVHSKEKDPDFFYGDAIELTLRELRANPEAYSGKKVAFKGVITMNHNNAVYIEDYDAESGLYYGMSVYYGYGLTGAGLDVLKVGNESRIVGTLQYYEAGGTWQVSGLSYRLMKPKDPGNIQKLSDGHSPAYVLTSPELFAQGQVELEVEDAVVTCDYAALAVGTSVEMKDLLVKHVYTTMDEESSSYGAMTLTCEAQGQTIQVRTAALTDVDGQKITEDYFWGKTIDVRGIVDFYNGSHQIRVFTLDGVSIH